VLGLDLRAAFEQLHAQVANGAYAGRAIAPAAARLGGGVEEGLALGRLGRRHQHQRCHANQAYRLQIGQRVIADRRIEQLGNRHIAVDHHAEGVAVGRARHIFGSDIATGPDLVLDDDRLAQRFFQRLGQRAGGQVRRRPGWKADDQMQGFARPVVRCQRAGAGP